MRVSASILIVTLAVLALSETPAQASEWNTVPEVYAEAVSGEISAWVTVDRWSEGTVVADVVVRRSGGVPMVCTWHEIEGTAVLGTFGVTVVWPPEPGVEYLWVCRKDGAVVINRLVVYNPADPFNGAIDFIAATRAQALESLTLPSPASRSAPSAGALLVGLPTWFWTTTPWVPVVASATLAGTTSTVTATPTHTTWDPGDGSGLVTCPGPGTPRPAGAVMFPSCGHTYVWSGTYPATTTIHWGVSWSSSDGSTGPLAPQTTTSTSTFVVDQTQAILINP